jgi:pimeloyl-ACP methyl ester carboxylesterase
MGRSPQPVVAGVAHTTVFLDGFEAHVAEGGDGDPVVMLHGWPQHWWVWRHLLPRLAQDGHRVICPDLRGFGWRGTPGDGYSTDRFVSDLLDALDALDLDRVDLVGHDWGTFTGYKAWLQAPERFRQFVAMGAPSPHLRYTPRTVAQLWRYWYQQPLAAPIVGARTVRRLGDPRSAVGRWIGLQRLRTEEIAVYVQQFQDPARVDASIALYRDALLHAFITPLRRRYREARLTVPTLALHGTEDRPTHPGLVRSISGRADDIRIELLDGVGHFLLDEAPDRVVERVRAFLAR